ncbi:MAG: S41 family peptidase, partial [Fusobacteriota bacterium]
LRNVNYLLKILSKKDLNLYYKDRNVVLKDVLKGQSKIKREIVLLTNQVSYSGSTNLAANMKLNGIATLIGEKTGGGAYVSGKPYILPDNNVLAIPTYAHVVDKDGKDFENGVIPDIEVEDKLIDGKDMVLEYAIKYLKDKTEE